MKKNTLLTLSVLALLVVGLSLQAAVTRTSTPAIGPFGAVADCTGTDGTGTAALSDSIVFSEVASGMTDVNVRVAFNHSFRSDLQFHVTYSGGGGTVVLAADDGGFADNDYFATFDDAAATSCANTTAGAQCGSGSACSAANTPGPTCSPVGALAAFNTLAVPGTFSLIFCDDAGGDSGTLASWAVTADGPPQLPVELLEFDIQ